MHSTLLEPEIQNPNTGNGRFMVTIFNNETNSLEEVVGILMRATGCDHVEAEMETWDAHLRGKAAVHFSNEATCNEVASIISSIGVKTTVTPEWED